MERSDHLSTIGASTFDFLTSCQQTQFHIPLQYFPSSVRRMHYLELIPMTNYKVLDSKHTIHLMTPYDRIPFPIIRTVQKNTQYITNAGGAGSNWDSAFRGEMRVARDLWSDLIAMAVHERTASTRLNLSTFILVAKIK